MLRTSLVALVLGVAGPVLAQGSPPPAAAKPASPPASPAQSQYSPLPPPQSAPKPLPAAGNPGPKPQDVISALTTDINGDATLDRILLAQTDDGDADLYVYLGKDSPQGGLAFHPPIVAKAIVFGGTSFGQWPSLEMNKAGTSLLVHSQNEAIGRSAWNQTLTVAWRNNQLVIAGLTYNFRDKLDLSQAGSCDVNFLSGKALRNGKPHPEKVAPLPLSAFDPQKMPKACEF